MMGADPTAARIADISNGEQTIAPAPAVTANCAKETAELTRTQILQQTSTTVLAQANQRPQAALSLLQG